MKIHIIRHGKTLANEQRLYCGQTDLPLSENGIAGLLELKKQGIYPAKADMYFTSGLARTEQTLDLLYGQVPREALPQLGEYRFGSFEMKSHDELNPQADYQAWIMDDSGQYVCPGGESRQGFKRRVAEGYGELLANTSGCEAVFVVFHGGVITTIMEELFPNRHNFYEWQPAPGRGYTIVYADGGAVSYTKI